MCISKKLEKQNLVSLKENTTHKTIHYNPVLSIFVVLPFILIPLDNAYFEGMDNMMDLPTKGSDLVFTAGNGILNSIVSFPLFYFIGKKLR